jgi:hypothetical protein
LGGVVLAYRLSTGIEVPGYTAIILSVMFFGGLTAFGLGIVGQYLWLTLQNTRERPNYLIWKAQTHTPEATQSVVKAAAPSERPR